MDWINPAAIHNPTDGGFVPAAWLDVVRGDLLWLAARPVCLVTGATGVDHNTTTPLEFDINLRDNFGGHPLGGDLGTLTIPLGAGLWEVGITAQWVASSTGRRLVAMLLDGSIAIRHEVQTPTASLVCTQQLVTHTRGSATTTRDVTFTAVQTSGGPLIATTRAWLRQVSRT